MFFCLVGDFIFCWECGEVFNVCCEIKCKFFFVFDDVFFDQEVVYWCFVVWWQWCVSDSGLDCCVGGGEQVEIVGVEWYYFFQFQGGVLCGEFFVGEMGEGVVCFGMVYDGVYFVGLQQLIEIG